MKSDKYAPDLSHVPSRISETVAEIIYSRSNRYRVIIAKNRQNNFHIYTEKWDISDWEFTNRGYWLPEGGENTLTDTVETAKKLAQEKLRCTPEGIAPLELQ